MNERLGVVDASRKPLPPAQPKNRSLTLLPASQSMPILFGKDELQQRKGESSKKSRKD